VSKALDELVQHCQDSAERPRLCLAITGYGPHQLVYAAIFAAVSRMGWFNELGCLRRAGNILRDFMEAAARMIVVMSDLAAKACVPCRGGVPPLNGEELASLQKQVDGWNVIEEHHITKTFKFPDFRGALKFVNRVGELAEEQAHHPDIFLAWGKVEITTWTHKINGLTESDFILAAKIDQLYKP
jgi:4a-hydroxytetrahydrobiopterin dehydratase